MIKEAVLLINLGTPDDPSPSKVGQYLTQFLNDKRVIDINPVGRFFLVNFIIVPFRRFASSKLYQKIWTDKGSPLMLYGEELKKKVQQRLGEKYTVELAMRYRKPSIKEILEKLRRQRPSRIHILPLYPQYASSSTGSTLEEVMRIVKGWEVIPSLNIISKFHEQDSFIDAFAKVAGRFDHSQYDHVLFSYHGLPERQILKASAHYGNNTCNFASCCDTLNQDNQYCYRANCMDTTRRLVKALGIPEGKYSSAFQSRLDDKWLKPYSDKVVAELAKKGKKKLLVFSPAFVADCLETIHEIGTEYDEIFKHNGGEKITLVPSLNAEDVWVEAVLKLII